MPESVTNKLRRDRSVTGLAELTCGTLGLLGLAWKPREVTGVPHAALRPLPMQAGTCLGEAFKIALQASEGRKGEPLGET